jgi:hypothetical protein
MLRFYAMSELEQLPFFQYNRHDDEDVNTGSAWSEQDDSDLLQMIKRHRGLLPIAEYLCRSEREVRERALQLGHKLPTGWGRRKGTSGTE